MGLLCYATFRFRFIVPSMPRWISDFYNYYYAINPPPVTFQDSARPKRCNSRWTVVDT